MIEYCEKPYLIIGIELNHHKVDDILSKYHLVYDNERHSSWDPIALRLENEPAGTGRYQIKNNMGAKTLVGRIFARGDSPIEPHMLEEMLAEVRKDIPEAQVYLFSGVWECDRVKNNNQPSHSNGHP